MAGGKVITSKEFLRTASNDDIIFVHDAVTKSLESFQPSQKVYKFKGEDAISKCILQADLSLFGNIMSCRLEAKEMTSWLLPFAAISQTVHLSSVPIRPIDPPASVAVSFSTRKLIGSRNVKIFSKTSCAQAHKVALAGFSTSDKSLEKSKAVAASSSSREYFGMQQEDSHFKHAVSPEVTFQSEFFRKRRKL